MNPGEQYQQQEREGGARRIASALARPRTYLLLLVPALGAALAMTLMPRGLSLADAASSDEGVTWIPGEFAQDHNAGQCALTFSGSVGSPNTGLVLTALGELPKQVVNQDQTKDYGIASVGPYIPAGTTITGRADAVCPVLPTDVPGRIAVGDLAATAAYIGIGSITIGTLLAYSATLPQPQAAEFTSGALSNIAGCIGRAAATATLLAIDGSTSAPLATVASTVTSCLSGTDLGNMPMGTVGAWIGNEVQARLGGAIPEVVGDSLASAAAQSNVDLSPVATAVADVVAGANAA